MLKPQDIFVLLALVARDDDEWTYDRLSSELGMSPSQVFASLERCEAAELFVKDGRRVIVRNLLEFVVHGIRYAFAVEPGKLVRGVSADWQAPGLSDLMAGGSEVRVWPSASGEVRGQAVEPLHASVPDAVLENPLLHALLALADIIRVGSARERRVASDELTRRLS
jgi:hypothetical protein